MRAPRALKDCITASKTLHLAAWVTGNSWSPDSGPVHLQVLIGHLSAVCATDSRQWKQMPSSLARFLRVGKAANLPAWKVALPHRPSLLASSMRSSGGDA